MSFIYYTNITVTEKQQQKPEYCHDTAACSDLGGNETQALNAKSNFK